MVISQSTPLRKYGVDIVLSSLMDSQVGIMTAMSVRQKHKLITLWCIDS